MKSTLIDLCLKLDIPYYMVLSESRQKDLVMVRMIFANIVRGHGSLSEIGECINRDHATVLHYFKTYRNLLACNDIQLNRMLDKYHNESVEEFYMNSLI